MHLHHFIDGICSGAAARPKPCGDAQKFRFRAGDGPQFSDVLVEKDDLRELIERYRGQCAMPDADGDALCDRLEELLDT